MALFGKNNWFYNESIRRYTVLFGSIFNDMYVKRVEENSGREDFIKVPLKFSSGFLYEKLNQDSESRENTRTRQILPAMAFDLTTIHYDPGRKHNEFQTITNDRIMTNDTVSWVYNPMPFKFFYTLYIRTKNSDDLFQLIEQIIPPFNTSYTVRMDDLPKNKINLQRDISISLIDLKWEDNYEEVTNKDTRKIDAELTFQLNGYIYSRIYNDAVIREVEILGGVTGNFANVPVESIFNTSDTTNVNLQTVRNADKKIAEVQDSMFTNLSVENVEKKSKSVKPNKRKST